MDDAMDDVEFLARSPNRVAVLDALNEEPIDRRQLQERLDVDRVTLGRILGECEQRGWVTVDDACSLTVVGRLVADEFADFRRFLAATRDLRSLVGVEPVEDPSFPADRLTAATITTAADGDPYAPIRRFMDLLAASDTLRGYDTTTIAPMYVEDIREEILDGMRTEVVYRPSVIAQIVGDYREAVAEAVDAGLLSLWVADDLSCGLAIFDDRVAIGAYAADTGTLDVFVDTDDEAIREWAIDGFQTTRDAAVPLTDWLEEPLS